jgi:hypothetical protein
LGASNGQQRTGRNKARRYRTLSAQGRVELNYL